MDRSTLAALIGMVRRIPKGDAASVRIGEVTSGEQPSVTNSGDNKDAVFNFTIPALLVTDDGNGNVSIN